MSAARGLVLLGCALVACSCGAASEDSSHGSALQAPPINAIDEPAAAVVRAQAERWGPAVRPIEGTQPRAIARLDLASGHGDKGVALVTWRSRLGPVCLAIETKNHWGEGAFVFGCQPDVPPCRDLCLARSAYGRGSEITYVLFGTVAAVGDELEVTYDSGEIARFALTGPRLLGSPSSRVFMLELGHRLLSRLELRSGGELIASEHASVQDLEWDRCLMELEDANRSSMADDAYSECADRAEALGPFGD